MPDISLLLLIAEALDCTTDMLLDYSVENKQITDYENRYATEEYYWGTKPSAMCLDVIKRLPPDRPL